MATHFEQQRTAIENQLTEQQRTYLKQLNDGGCNTGLIFAGIINRKVPKSATPQQVVALLRLDQTNNIKVSYKTNQVLFRLIYEYTTENSDTEHIKEAIGLIVTHKKFGAIPSWSNEPFHGKFEQLFNRNADADKLLEILEYTFDWLPTDDLSASFVCAYFIGLCHQGKIRTDFTQRGLLAFCSKPLLTKAARK